MSALGVEELLYEVPELLITLIAHRSALGFGRGRLIGMAPRWKRGGLRPVRVRVPPSPPGKEAMSDER